MNNLKEIPGFSNYLADAEGNIYAKNYMRQKGNLKKMSPILSKRGYYKNQLVNDEGKSKQVKFHRLVMFAFNGISDLHVNHINGIKTDNRLENLEYCTHSENMKHGFKIGLINNTGENNGQSKLSTEDIVYIKKAFLNSYIGLIKDLMLKYNVCRNTISDIKYNRTWKHVTI